MADWLLDAWWLGVLGYAIGLVVHCEQIWVYRRYLAHARYPGIVRGWIFDESNRAAVKLILTIWGVARVGLITLRAPGASTLPVVVHLDLLTLGLYWTLLLLLTHWTWRVRKRRRQVTREWGYE